MVIPIINIITEDSDVQFYWTLISQDIDEEEDAMNLLKELVTMWTTIRGFSMAATCIKKHNKHNQLSRRVKH